MTIQMELLGFDCTLLQNPTMEEFLTALEEFISKIRPGDVVMFFFAGHGVEWKNANRMMLRDTQVNALRLERTTVSIQGAFIVFTVCHGGGKKTRAACRPPVSRRHPLSTLQKPWHTFRMRAPSAAFWRSTAAVST